MGENLFHEKCNMEPKIIDVVLLLLSHVLIRILYLTISHKGSLLNTWKNETVSDTLSFSM